MNIQLHCPGCNRELSFPPTAAGRQSKCPGCSHRVYVPTPADELKELPFASDDQTPRGSDAAARAERRMLARILAGDALPQSEQAAAQSSTAAQTSSASPSIEQLIVGYLAAMRDSDLSRADTCLAHLRNHRPEALNGIDRLAADQIPPAAVQNIPPGVYQGFLRNLRSQL